MEKKSISEAKNRNLRVPRKNPASSKEKLALALMFLLFIWLTLNENDCKSPVKFWMVIECVLVGFLLVFSIISSFKQLYIDFETIIKLGKIIIFIIQIPWIFVGGYWISYDNTCYDVWPLAYFIIIFSNILILSSGALMILMVLALIIPELFKQKKVHKTL